MPIDLTLLSAGPFRPGETVRGVVDWSTTEPPERIEARLIWRTSGKGTTDRVIAVAEVYDNPQAAGRWEADLTVPVEAPPSYDGHMLSVEWVAEANTGRREDAAERRMVVSPVRRPIVPGAAVATK